MRPELSPEEKESRIQFYQDPLYPGWPSWLLPAIAIGLYLGTTAFVYWAHTPDAGETRRVLSAILIGGWTLGPPTWLFIEYFRMPYIDSKRLPNIDSFKYTREIARNFWVAAVLVLLALNSGHFPGAPD